MPPDLDRAWAAFVRHGVTPVFHVSAFPHPFHDAWYEDDDPDDVAPVLSSVFLWTAPALALADLAIHGVFARHPDLRLGIMELSAVWVPMYLLMLDGGFAFHERFNGECALCLFLDNFGPHAHKRRLLGVFQAAHTSLPMDEHAG